MTSSEMSFFAIIVRNNLYDLVFYILFREVFTKLAMDQDSGTSHTLQEKQETNPKIVGKVR
jgi:hypothetical protein